MAVDTPLVMAIMVRISDMVATTHTNHPPLLIHHKCLDHLLQVPHRVATDPLQVHHLQVLLLKVFHQDRHQDHHQDLHQVRHLVCHLEPVAVVYHPVTASLASPTC
jgi:hypothetical protein